MNALMYIKGSKCEPLTSHIGSGKVQIWVSEPAVGGKSIFGITTVATQDVSPSFGQTI